MSNDAVATSQQTKLAAALALADYGFSVFPLVPNEKRPLIENWRNLATNNPDQVRQWWNAEPNANIGVSTENLLVIDVDPRNGGNATFTEVITTGQITGEEFPGTLAAGTQGGGTHMLYWLRHGTQVRGDNRGRVLGKGLDIKSYGGFIVGAGSTIDGRPYYWKQGYEPNKREFAEAPQWLVQRCNAPRQRSAEAGKVVAEEDDAALALAERYIADNAPEAIQGGRDNTAYTIAARLYDFGVSPATCRELLAEWNETKCHPPLDDDELERLTRSARTNRENAVGSKHPNAPGFEATEIAEKPADALAPKTGRFGHFTYWRADEGARSALAQIGDPLIKGIIHRGAMSVLIGAPGGGKTFFVLDWAYHIAAGKEWAGRQVKQGAVVYLAAEAGNMIKARVAALERHYGPLGDTPLFVVPCPADFAHGPEDAAAMLRLIQDVERVSKQKVEFFVVDTLNRALAGGDENSSKDVGALIRNVDLIRDRAGVHALVIHHPGKDEAKGGRGHSSVLGGTDTEMQISRHVLTFTKQRDMPLGEDIGFKLKPVQIGVDADGAPVTSCVVQVRKKGEPADTVPLTKTEMFVLDALEQALEEKAEKEGELIVDLFFDWRFVVAACRKVKPDINPTRQTVTGWMSDMSEKGWIEKTAPNQYVMKCREMSESVGK